MPETHSYLKLGASIELDASSEPEASSEQDASWECAADLEDVLVSFRSSLDGEDVTQPDSTFVGVALVVWVAWLGVKVPCGL